MDLQTNSHVLLGLDVVLRLVIQSVVFQKNTLDSEIDFVFYVSYAEYPRNRKLSS